MTRKKGSHYYTLVVIYKGYDGKMDRRIRGAFSKSGVSHDGGGYFFPSNERDLVFFSKGNLRKATVSRIRTIARNVRRWKHVTKVALTKELKDW